MKFKNKQSTSFFFSFGIFVVSLTFWFLYECEYFFAMYMLALYLYPPIVFFIPVRCPDHEF